jgi:transposase
VARDFGAGGRCVLDHTGQIRYARNLPANPQAFRKAIQPFREGIIRACEGMHCWYWLADTCREDNIPFALGHAWGMKAVHGSKTKCDRKDAEAIARLLKGGNFPPANAYPKERRGLRDLLRARLRPVRQRAELYGHIHTARRQLNLPPIANDVKYKSKRAAITADIDDACVRRRVEADLSLLEPLDTTIRRLEKDIELAAHQHYATELAVLQSTPGVGFDAASAVAAAGLQSASQPQDARRQAAPWPTFRMRPAYAGTSSGSKPPLVRASSFLTRRATSSEAATTWVSTCR